MTVGWHVALQVPLRGAGCSSSSRFRRLCPARSHWDSPAQPAQRNRFVAARARARGVVRDVARRENQLTSCRWVARSRRTPAAHCWNMGSAAIGLGSTVAPWPRHRGRMGDLPSPARCWRYCLGGARAYLVGKSSSSVAPSFWLPNIPNLVSRMLSAFLSGSARRPLDQRRRIQARRNDVQMASSKSRRQICFSGATRSWLTIR